MENTELFGWSSIEEKSPKVLALSFMKVSIDQPFVRLLLYS